MPSSVHIVWPGLRRWSRAAIAGPPGNLGRFTEEVISELGLCRRAEPAGQTGRGWGGSPCLSLDGGRSVASLEGRGEEGWGGGAGAAGATRVQ